MAKPDGKDLAFFFVEIDKRRELFGARVVYFDGGTMSVLRQGPPMCQSGLLAVVIRKGGKELIPTASEVAEARDQRFFSIPRFARRSALTSWRRWTR